MARSAIEVREVYKRYSSKTAVDGVDLSVGQGQLCGFLGCNGAGKSTTIGMMCGLLRPDSGNIEILGHDVVTNPLAAKSSVALVHDKPMSLPGLTGRDMVEFSALAHGGDPHTVKSRADETLKKVGLSEAADESVQGYSHGMQQRAALATALVFEPPVLVLDEPTAGLDPQGKRLIRNILLEIVGQGRTVFMATHDLDEADELCDQVAIIDEGKLLAKDSPDNLKRQMIHASKTLSASAATREVGSAKLEEVFFWFTGKYPE